MTQREFGNALGVSSLTVSQWETGYRKASSLATKAIEMLRELGRREERWREKLQRTFNQFNAEYFGNQIKGRYKFELSERMKRTKAAVWPSKKLIKFSRSFLLNSRNKAEVRATLKHEMVHLWLYERGMSWEHTKEFKAKLKSIGKK